MVVYVPGDCISTAVRPFVCRISRRSY